ncbi:uncharacterized protein [Rutidosis leptorrhynchoides]|uniref:uncharacterized protein n=1 Tax=Rutidosis leptorrhynchoides TaxID=125765 RepID=UPI003A993A89
MCNGQPDSHDHLFFKCLFSAQLHMKFGQLAMMPDWCCSWKSTRDTFIPFAARNLSRMVVPKIVFAATVYFIWQERNSRLFGGKARSVDQMFEIIFSTVRMKLLSLKFKESYNVRVMKDNWKVP